MQQQAEAYKVAGVDENAPALNPAQKRKQAQLEDVSHPPATIHHFLNSTDTFTGRDQPKGRQVWTRSWSWS